LIFGETTTTLINNWPEGAFLLLGLLKINLGDLYPAHFCLVICKPVKHLFLIHQAKFLYLFYLDLFAFL
jgi:hypothetical protein